MPGNVLQIKVIKRNVEIFRLHKKKNGAVVGIYCGETELFLLTIQDMALCIFPS